MGEEYLEILDRNIRNDPKVLNYIVMRMIELIGNIRFIYPTPLIRIKA